MEMDVAMLGCSENYNVLEEKWKTHFTGSIYLGSFFFSVWSFFVFTIGSPVLERTVPGRKRRVASCIDLTLAGQILKQQISM